MTDFNKLVALSNPAPIKDSVNHKADGSRPASRKIKDSVKERIAKKKAIKDAIQRRRDAHKYSNFKVTDSYKNALKRIKDELEETDSTDAAIDTALEALNELPADQVVAAVVEVLSEAIDVLQGDSCPECAEGESEEAPEAETPQADPESGESEGDEVADSVSVTVDNGSETVSIEAEGGDSVVAADAPAIPPADEVSLDGPEGDAGLDGTGADIPVDEEPLGDSVKAPTDDEIKKLAEALKADGADVSVEQLKKAYAAFRSEQLN